MQFFNKAMLNELSLQAKNSPRLRSNRNVHSSLEDTVQRLFIAMEPGSYVRPHRHSESEKWEFFMMVRGKIAMLIFDEEGLITRRIELTPTTGQHGLEIPPNTWHTVVALETNTVFFEVKQGPYTPLAEKDLATWAPKEGLETSKAFIQWFAQAQEGERPPRD